MPALAAILLVTVASCTCFGMLLGSIGLRAKDFFFAANLAYFLMLLFCGVNIPLSVLPGWMSAVGRCLPLTHGIAAAREVAAGASLGSVVRARLDRGGDRRRVRGGGLPALPHPRARVAPQRRARRVLRPRAGLPQAISWSRSARATACVRVSASSFAIALRTCVRTVSAEMKSLLADLLVREAVGEQPQHVALAARQLRQLRSRTDEAASVPASTGST